MQRFRAPNFTNSENSLLCECIKKRRHIIDNKNLDRATVSRKQKAWLEVEEEFNSNSHGYTRTLDSLQQNYKNLKRKNHIKLQSPMKEADECNGAVSENDDGVFPQNEFLKVQLVEEQDRLTNETVSAQNELFKIQLIDEQERLAHNRLLRKMQLEDAKKMYEHNEAVRNLQLESVYNNV